MADLSEADKQIMYRDARVSGKYDEIWQSVGKCVFCDLNDKYVFYEENGVVMTVALFAYIDGHFMIIPRRHVRSVKDLTPSEWETMRKFMYIAKKLIRETHGIKGMQIVQKDGATAQSTVEHIHFHCVPFDQPDLNTWHYRQLDHTPAENAAMYQDKHEKIAKLSQRFAKKYQDD
ncbi:MAG: histidine triad protein [Candidatus Saccharibacteria bacterium]|nr:histidine triad protein [Candidatus Saccharibacteria bacterium]